MNLDGPNVEFVTLWNFHHFHNVRAADIVNTLKHWWCFIERLRNGKSEMELFLQSICSISSHVLSD